MASLVARNSWILAASEGASYATDATPAGLTAIKCQEINLTPLAGDVVERSLIKGYLGADPTLIANAQSALSLRVELTSSGTPGTPPAVAPLLTACGLAETITNTAITGQAQAGAANSITLAAAASAVDDFYTGMPIVFTAGTENGKTAQIIGYNGTTKVAELVNFDNGDITPDNTTEYSIPANVMYSPISDIDGVDDTSATVYCFMDKILHKLRGARGNIQIAMGLGAIPSVTIDLLSLYTDPEDEDTPKPVFQNQANPHVFRKGKAGAFQALGARSCLQDFSINLGNTLEYRGLIGCEEKIIIPERRVTGSATVETKLIADRNYFAAALDDNLQGSGSMSILHGVGDGRRVGMVAKSTDLGQPSYTIVQGIYHTVLPFAALPIAPGNNELRICFS